MKSMHSLPSEETMRRESASGERRCERLEDPDGTIIEDGIILPNQDPDAPDTAIICLPPDFFDDHIARKGFVETRDYTPYYAKKFLTRPIEKVKILYGHQSPNNPKNKWILWKFDKIEVEFDDGEIYTSPFRKDGTLKRREDYGTDLPITRFIVYGHTPLAGTTERTIFSE